MSKCVHDGLEPIKAGPYEVFASGLLHHPDFENFDVLVPLDHQYRYNGNREVIMAIIPDYHPPGPDFAGILRDRVIPALEAGKRVLIFCLGSHGRTGTAIAGLIAMLEPEVDDPIEAVRKRHCGKSVETPEQALWVRALHSKVLAQRITEVMADGDPC
jgi:protein-tyrosine phosphatase